MSVSRSQLASLLLAAANVIGVWVVTVAGPKNDLPGGWAGRLAVVGAVGVVVQAVPLSLVWFPGVWNQVFVMATWSNRRDTPEVVVVAFGWVLLLVPAGLGLLGLLGLVRLGLGG